VKARLVEHQLVEAREAVDEDIAEEEGQRRRRRPGQLDGDVRLLHHEDVVIRVADCEHFNAAIEVALQDLEEVALILRPELVAQQRLRELHQELEVVLEVLLLGDHEQRVVPDGECELDFRAGGDPQITCVRAKAALLTQARDLKVWLAQLTAVHRLRQSVHYGQARVRPNQLTEERLDLLRNEEQRFLNLRLQHLSVAASEFYQLALAAEDARAKRGRVHVAELVARDQPGHDLRSLQVPDESLSPRVQPLLASVEAHELHLPLELGE